MTRAAFPDHFSGHAALYARVRPHYPAELYEWLAAEAPHRRLAWDAGTGNGQAAAGLARHFERVVATDASAQQIEEAPAHPRVEYRVSAAEQSPLPPGSAALVTAAQAAHWFDLPAFFEAAREALVPSGLVALWGYDLMHVTPGVDAAVGRLYGAVVGPYWPPERKMVETGYRTLSFPFEELSPPPLAMEQHWDLAALNGYLRSWSAAQRYAAETGIDPVTLIARELEAAWGDPHTVRPVSFPLFMRVGRTEG